jgi:phage terminase Nu1 subunit (DNA packaging protein)
VSELAEHFTQQQFADVVGITQQRVSSLFSRGILGPDMTLQEGIAAYCASLREQAAGRAAEGDLNLAAERARLARAQREKIEMQNAVKRRELAPLSLLEETLAKAGAKVAGVLDAIPGMLRRRNPDLTAADLDVIAKEIAAARNVAAAISIDDLELETLVDDETVAA